ncbi:MAG: universal stress protein [Myxococcales bacterium]|nr:universal stress protein [Myxococcales bacterium]MCB9707898.1 universal stress protein [Myxococcales bacterium]
MSTSKIIVATDFRTLSDTCVRVGAELGAALGVDVDVIHASDLVKLEGAAAVPSGMHVVNDALLERLNTRRKGLELKLQHQLSAHGNVKNAVVHARFVDDRPWHAIVEASKPPGTQLVVIGSRGPHRSTVERVLGTTTERVVRHALGPVLVLHPDAFTSTLLGTHWIVGVDFSPSSVQAARYAVELAQNTGGRVTLMHVLPFGQGRLEVDIGDALHHEWVDAAQVQLSETAQKLGGSVQTRVIPEERDQSSGQTLCSAAQQEKDAVLVLSAGEHSTVSRVLLGSTAERSLRYATMPVLIVR